LIDGLDDDDGGSARTFAHLRFVLALASTEASIRRQRPRLETCPGDVPISACTAPAARAQWAVMRTSTRRR